MSYCIRVATAKNGKPSKLWQDLMDKYHDYTTVKGIYSLVTRPSYIERNESSLIFDANGEPTLESLEGAMNGVNLNTAAQASSYERQYNSVGFQSASEAIQKAIEFNSQHDDLIMDIEENADGKVQVSVRTAGLDSKIRKEQIVASQNEFKAVEGILKRFGLDVNVVDTLPMGVYSQMRPEFYGTMGQGLLGVVNIANNLAGFNSLTDTFSSLLLEVMRSENNPVVERAEKFLLDNPEFIRDIFTEEEYDEIIDSYGMNMLATRALGKIVAGLVNQTLESKYGQITGRAAEAMQRFINSVFKTKDKGLINAVNKLVDDLKGSVSELMGRDTLSDETLKAFAKLGRTVNQIHRILNESLERLRRAERHAQDNLLKFRQVYVNSENDESEATRAAAEAALVELALNAQQNKFVEGALGYIQYVNETVTNNFEALKATSMSGELTMVELKQRARSLMALHNLVESNREPVNEIKLALLEMLEDDKVDADTKAVVESLASTAVTACIDTINTVEEQLVNLNKETIKMIAKHYFGDKNGEMVIPYGKHKGELISVENFIDCSMGDINILQRLLVSASNTDDMFIQIMDDIITDQDEAERGEAMRTIHKIQALDKALRKSMGRNYSTSFIYERDDKGEKTGNLVSGYKIWEWQRAMQAEEDRLRKQFTDRYGELDNKAFQAEMDKWHSKNSQKIKRFDPRTYIDNGMPKLLNPKPREFWMPNNKYKDNDFQKGWTEEQKKYYDGYVKIKQTELDFLLPMKKVHPYRSVQIMIASTGEAILNSDSGILGGFKSAAKSVMDNYFRITENDNGDYYDGSNSKVKDYIRALKMKYNINNKGKEGNIRTTFDKRVYNEVPTYFVKTLEDMSKLSTDGTSALIEYAIMATHYKCMHSIADMMELFREHSRHRRIEQIDGAGKKIREKIATKIEGDEYSAEIDAVFPTEATNVFKRGEELIDMRIYNKSREQGVRVFGTNTGKIIDDLIKLTSFSLLGYSAFSGINNVLMAKQQMLIESFGGRYFTVKDWLKADKEFMKNAYEVFAELHTPYTTSLLGLVGEMFGVGQNWKETVKKSRAYRNNFEQFMANFGPSCLLESGEYSIQMSTAISTLLGYKLYKGPIVRDKDGNITNESVSLWEAIEKYEKKNKDGLVVDAALKIKDEYKDYVKEDGNKFVLFGGSKDVKKLSKLIGHVNQMMHGIYNKEDQAVLTRYGVGRMLLLFRKHMVPQLQNRYRGLGKGRPIYNFRTGEFEEGYMVTWGRVMLSMLRSRQSIRQLMLEDYDDSASWPTRIAVLYNSLTKYEKANFKKAMAEIMELAAIFILASVLLVGWDDEDEWWKRQVYYFSLRMNLEATMPYSPSSFMDVLVSPSATISQLQRYGRLLGSIGKTDQILQSGPYKGHSVFYANLMRAMPVYPQIHDFIHIDEDNHRFQVFSTSQTPVLDLLGLSEEGGEE